MGDRNSIETRMGRQSPRLTQSTRACDECKRKKTRCDRKLPRCGLCERTGRNCEFPRKRKTYTRNLEPRKRLHNHTTDLDLEWLLTTLQDNPLSEAPASFHQMAFPPGGFDMNMDIFCSQPNQTNLALGQETDTTAVNMIAHESENFQPPSQSPTSCSEAGTCNGHAGISQSLVRFDVSGFTSNHLIDLFFDNVQPWLPMLHKPKFVRQFTRDSDIDDVLRGLPPDEALLLCGVFALAARFSPLETFSDLPDRDRGQDFSRMATHFYSLCRHITSPTLVYLQGCIMHAFYFYCSGVSSQGWILSGVCVRLAYELGLFDMDDEDSDVGEDKTWSEKEEMRRAWWLVWELDTFGSAVCCRPFMIDPSRMSVFLPVADERWFSDANTPSAKLHVRPGCCWKSLHDVENQSPRAYFLVANFLFSQVQSLCQRRGGVSEGKLVCLANDISCSKLALPSSMSLGSSSIEFGSSTADRNWAIGTHFMLLSSSRIIQAAVSRSHSKSDYIENDQVRAAVSLAYEKSRVLSRWEKSDVATAHPFFAFMLLTLPPESDSERSMNASEAMALESCHDLAILVQHEFARKWNLGVVASRIAQLSQHPERIVPEDWQLIKRHAAFFSASVRNSVSACAKSPKARSQQTMPRNAEDSRGNPSPDQNTSAGEQPAEQEGNAQKNDGVGRSILQIEDDDFRISALEDFFGNSDRGPQGDFI